MFFSIELRIGVYFGFLKLFGMESEATLQVANNYADLLKNLNRFEEAKALWRETIPVARRVLGDNREDTIRMRWNYAKALCIDEDVTFEDLREAVATLEEVERLARRVFGGAHPFTVRIEGSLGDARTMLRVRSDLRWAGVL